MTTTWADIDSQLSIFLDDRTISSLSYPADLRMIAWNRACEFFASTHTAPLMKYTATASALDDNGVWLALPSDFLEMGGIEVLKDPLTFGYSIQSTPIKQTMWLENNLQIPGHDTSRIGYTMVNGMLWFPNTYVSALTMWYYRLYRPITADADVIEIPQWAVWGVFNLAIAYSLIPFSIGVADLRRFQSRREAGSPEENSSRVQARYHHQVYLDQIKGVKPQDRQMLFVPGRN